MDNEKKYDIFSQNARQRTLTHFDKSIVVPMYEDHYKQILNS